MNNRKNFISAIVYQVVILIQGLVLPRLIIATFSSEVNGLVSSITQFLSFISLLEGGLGAVVLAELYRPIEENDYNKVQNIVVASQKLFRKIAFVYILYTFGVAFGYPIFFAKDFSFGYTYSLVIILSITTLSQYLFAISNRLILQAVQKIYIVNFVAAVAVIANLVIAIVLIELFPSIHLVKLFSGIVFLIQPIIFSCVVDNRYKFKEKNYTSEKYEFKNRWSGFGQNLAYFINMNTDIAVITVFSGLNSVSVYAIYMLAINALRQLITSIAISYQSALGRYYVLRDIDLLKRKFEKFNHIICGGSIVLYCSCLQLINQFVGLYTAGVKDADYYQPIFALIMTLANMFYCIREPYRVMVLSAGKFKETNIGAILEAALNIVLSIALILWFGLIGVAIGTIVAITYRLLYLYLYTKRNLIDLENRKLILIIIESTTMIVINVAFYCCHLIRIDTIVEFFIFGIIALLIETIVFVIIHFICNRLFHFFRKIIINSEKR